MIVLMGLYCFNQDVILPLFNFPVRLYELIALTFTKMIVLSDFTSLINFSFYQSDRPGLCFPNLSTFLKKRIDFKR